MTQSIFAISLKQDDISLKQNEMKEEVMGAIKSNEPLVSKSFTELGQIALKAMEKNKRSREFTAIEGEPSLLSSEQACELRKLTVEVQVNCFISCFLSESLESIGLVIVNSETSPWLETFCKTTKLDRKPDFIICPNFMIALNNKHNSMDVECLAIKSKIIGENPLYYGIPAGGSLFLDELSIAEGKVSGLGAAEYGQVKTYAGLQAQKVTNATFHRFILFDREGFVLILTKGGDFIEITSSGWDTPGNKTLLLEFFDFERPMKKCFDGLCSHFDAKACDMLTTPLLLGAGGTGKAFRVKLKEPMDTVLSSTRSESLLNDELALKAVVGDHTTLLKLNEEYQLLTRAQASNLVVRLRSKLYINFEEGYGGYMMERGSSANFRDVQSRKDHFMLLYSLHKSGFYHGDARKENVVLIKSADDVRLKWIDFMSAFFGEFEDNGQRIKDDFITLYKSLYGSEISTVTVEKYMNLVDDNEGNIMLFLDKVCI